jgi:glyoxylase I family protein
MKIEHFAINVAEPVAMADWYCKNMGMTVMRKQPKAPHTHFLADSSGSVMIEIYNNPADAVPPYACIPCYCISLLFPPIRWLIKIAW